MLHAGDLDGGRGRAGQRGKHNAAKRIAQSGAVAALQRFHHIDVYKRQAIDSYTVEGDLRRQTALDIKRLTEIGCYRGIRHRKEMCIRDRGYRWSPRESPR